jgi:uncharacterized damage-inducible protein DinB
MGPAGSLSRVRRRAAGHRSVPAAAASQEVKESKTGGGNVKWVERQLDFDFPASVYPELIERLRGTPSRLEKLVSSLPREVLVRREGEKWSIQENAGHLLDVESLFVGRLDDFESGASTLRPAEMTGRKTTEARHNDSGLSEILRRFRAGREAFIARLEAREPETFGASAMHPRLKRPMRLCDMLYFEAEHDDHHLARIGELIERFMPGQ